MNSIELVRTRFVKWLDDNGLQSNIITLDKTKGPDGIEVTFQSWAGSVNTGTCIANFVQWNDALVPTFIDVNQGYGKFISLL